jgi:DUF971 family protein
MNQPIAPRQITQVDATTLGIEWGDGTRHEFPVRQLRLNCSCASCVNEWTGEQLFDEGQIPPDVHPVSLENVGLYGIRIQWSDGHGTGIYTYDHLRRLGETLKEGA